jgi:hypothetical protein
MDKINFFWNSLWGYCCIFALLLYLLLYRNSAALWGFRENTIFAFLLSIVFLYLSLKQGKESIIHKSERIAAATWLPIFLLGAFTNLYTLKKVIAPFPMDKTQSDVIPQMQTLVQRFLSGANVYAPIDFESYILFPTYLPLQWMPFILPEIAHKDYRLFAFMALTSVFVFYIFSLKNKPWFNLLAILPFLIMNIGFWQNEASYYNCVENMMAAYYMAFALSLMDSKKVWLQSILLGFCLFSRYAIVLWTPLYFLFLYFQYGTKTMLKSLLIVFSMFCLFYGIPFLLKDPSIYAQGYAYHTQAALAEWATPSWAPNGYSVHLSNGLGFAIFFFEKIQGEIAVRLATLQKVHLSLSLLSVFLSAGIAWYRWKQHQIKPDAYFMLWTLAFYLTIFYQFIQIPYVYLFVIPIYVYLVLFKSALERNVD